MNQKTIAVMASGRGSNLQAILAATSAGACPVEISLVISDRAEAGALDIARQAGVPHVHCLNPKNYSSRAAFDAACAELIDQHGCHWVVLAGYMRILSSSFVHRFHRRIINIHPSLLPSFPGAKAVEDALEHGVKVSGCTVHLVDEVLDGGPILAQSAVAVLDHDTRDSLHARIQQEEHKLYTETLRRIVQNGFSVVGRRVVWKG